MQGDFYRWYSPHTGSDMDMLVFGHGGARVLVFPTSHGSYHEFRDRGMVDALSQHIHSGWLQVFCVSSFDAQSWYARYLPVVDRVANHLRYERYLVDEVLPFTRSLNPNPYLIALGCSFGAFHAALLGLRQPQLVDRVVGLSGYYDATRFLGPESGEAAYFVNPMAFVDGIRDERQRALIQRLDLILAVGRDDASYANNMAFSGLLWGQGIWHALRVWDGWSHDWPYWREMVLHYIGGPDTR
jgi:esterase/lipase superfamily enzyme